MARPPKQGLDYFPHDTHPDKKLERFYLLYKARGRSFISALWEEIYAEGDRLSIRDQDTIQILAEKAFLTVEEWNLMLAAALKLDLLDATIFEKEMVLTSNGIQRRYGMVAEKRARNAEHYQRVKAANQAANLSKSEFRMSETVLKTDIQQGFIYARKESKEKDLPSEDLIPPTPQSETTEDASKAEQPRRKPGRAKGPRMICPEDFQPSPTTREWCTRKGHPDPAPFVDAFVNYWRGRGELMADWQATFRNFMEGPFRPDKQEAKYGQNGSRGGNRFPTRGERLDRAASEFLRDLGGQAEGSGEAAAPDAPLRQPGTARS